MLRNLEVQAAAMAKVLLSNSFSLSAGKANKVGKEVRSTEFPKA
jgi:hypothetical protein